MTDPYDAAAKRTADVYKSIGDYIEHTNKAAAPNTPYEDTNLYLQTADVLSHFKLDEVGNLMSDAAHTILALRKSLQDARVSNDNLRGNLENLKETIAELRNGRPVEHPAED